LPRSRNIKPAFFTDGKMRKLPMCARYLFEGLWCLADREGRLDDEPDDIEVFVGSLGDMTVDECLSLLHPKFITRYAVSGRRYIQVNNFKRHQNPHPKEVKSVIPAPNPLDSVAEHEPNADNSCKPRNSMESRGIKMQSGLIPDSLPLIPDSLIKEAEEERVRARIDPSPPCQPDTLETAPNAFADSPDLPSPDSLEAYISNYVASTMTASHWQQLDDLLKAGMPDELIKLAIDEACAQGKATWAYINTILNRWLTSGVKTVAQARQMQAEFKATKTQPHSRDRPDRPSGGAPKFFDGGKDDGA